MSDPAIFRFSLHDYSLVRREGYQKLSVHLSLRDIEPSGFDAMRDDVGFKLGLRIFSDTSQSSVVCDTRADSFNVTDDFAASSSFKIYQQDFDENKPSRLAFVDFLYEDSFWFSEKISSGVYLSIANPYFVAERRDAFAYYKERTTGVSTSD